MRLMPEKEIQPQSSQSCFGAHADGVSGSQHALHTQRPSFLQYTISSMVVSHTARLLYMQATSTTLLLLYLAYREIWYMPRRHYKGWKPLRPSKGALHNWGPYLSLAFPAVMSHCMEGWATEVLIFLAGGLLECMCPIGRMLIFAGIALRSR